MEILLSHLNENNLRIKTKIEENEETHVNFLLEEKRLLVHLKMVF